MGHGAGAGAWIQGMVCCVKSNLACGSFAGGGTWVICFGGDITSRGGFAPAARVVFGRRTGDGQIRGGGEDLVG